VEVDIVVVATLLTVAAYHKVAEGHRHNNSESSLNYLVAQVNKCGVVNVMERTD